MTLRDEKASVDGSERNHSQVLTVTHLTLVTGAGSGVEYSDVLRSMNQIIKQ